MTNQSEADGLHGNILVVDDVPANLTLLAGMLKENSHRVRPVPSGKLALKAVENEPPDLILLDIMMPVMDGYETCRHLKENPKTRDIPVIFLTAKAEVEDEMKGFELGAVDYITKPISQSVVLARVQTHLRLKRMQDSLKDQNQFLDAAVQNRTKDLVTAQDKLEYLIQTGLELGKERDRTTLLRKILFGGKILLNCDAGTLYIVTEHKTLRFAQRTKSDELPSLEIPLYDETGAPVESYMATWCALHNEPIIVDDVYSETRFDSSGAKKMDAESGYRTVSILTVPLSPREGEVIGVLQFLNALDPETGKVIPFRPELLRFVTAMATQAAVALDNVQLIEAQKELLDAMIKLIAGAIDAKSPYTGGHCERVPELAVMLAEAASAVNEGPLAAFSFKTDEEWREFRIGAWLHDCGKVTTPEYVVDKASKLETIYNRIHEVRMRFEVLLRDARISQLESVAAGTNPEEAQARHDARRNKLTEDFAFIAECNLGGESMVPEKLERLKLIAEETWLRHYNDRIGMPNEELKRYSDEQATLPAIEKLLADKPHHIILRSDRQSPDPKWGFKIKVPENLYNYGEVYNLSIGRGTLTEEERFKITEHVMQSMMMLEQLPLPKNMRRIPEYAGTHHETLIGSGYPRKMVEAEITIPMRIMAIADVFEALTASDRPYKKTKTLSESINVLSVLKKDRHIDPALFDLLLTSGVYRRYAEKYLLQEQIDEVDISKYVDPTLFRGRDGDSGRINNGYWHIQ